MGLALVFGKDTDIFTALKELHAAAMRLSMRDGGSIAFKQFASQLQRFLTACIILFHSFLHRRPGVRDNMNFCRQFAVMLSAGIPVLAGLEILEKQTESAMLKQGIRTAAQSVEKGSSLKEALLQRKDLFSPFFTGMVDAGETGGILEQTMQRLACYFHNKYDLEQKIKSALPIQSLFLHYFYGSSFYLFLLSRL